ncbi:protein SCAR3-like isoform X2 [Andrographis paniculata]|uniref:protein SCAR3-like isoform X2 n=1 Tax=Andrographis paniculata TaxID=175694 RepID=UPI0021E79C64|nr:protein SCAR3-like isoform X2 [Andrographis paniculata]
MEVRNAYRLGAPETYNEASKEEPEEILGGVAVAGLVGILRQLADLVDFAAEVFHGLQEELMMTSSRSRNLWHRVRRIEAAISPLEKAVLAQRSHLHLAYVAGSNLHGRSNCEMNMFEHTDLPRFILDSYEDCGEPPRLHLLDRFDPGGPGSCFKRYSDPSFFKKASSRKVLDDKRGSMIKSQPRNEVTPGATLFNLGGSLRSDYTEGDFRLRLLSPRLDMDASRNDAVVSFETVDKRGIRSCDQDHSTSEYIDISFDEFENKNDIFMDACNVMELKDTTDMNYTRNKNSKLEGKAAELMQQNLECRTPYYECGGLARSSVVIGGFKHNPLPVSLKSSFAALFCVGCVSAKDLCDSASPVDKSLLPHSVGSYSNWDVNDGAYIENTLRTVSLDERTDWSGSAQRPSTKTSNASLASFRNNGGLVGLQPSKPMDFGLSNNHGEPDITQSSAHQRCEESNSWFRKMKCKISPTDLGFKLHSNDVSLTQAGSVPTDAAERNAEDSKNSCRIFEQGTRLHTTKRNDSEYQTLSGRTKDLFRHELSIPSPPSSPPLRQIKISFQPIDYSDSSKLKLKFPHGSTGDESCRAVLPSFQLVPELLIAQQNGCSDSDDDTLYRSSASSLDNCRSYHYESYYEQWGSGESPANKDTELFSFYSRVSCSESVSTTMKNERTSLIDRNYIQGSHSFHSCDILSTPDPSSIPPVEWHGMKPNLDYTLNLNELSSTTSQQPKPAPFDHDFPTIEQRRKDSDGQREANKGKSLDDRDFLQLIRSKSFNLRPTVTKETATPSASPANVHVAAILNKANLIRQAVGSDDADDDGGNWSDV